MKILICENEEIMLTALEFRLRKNGFEVMIAKDGEQAVNLFTTQKPDLIVADMKIPKFSGLELVKFVREEENSDLPIILISPMEDAEELLRALELGATDFVSKPFNPNELLLRIRRVLGKY